MSAWMDPQSDPWMTPCTSPLSRADLDGEREAASSQSGDAPEQPRIEYWMWRDGVLIPAIKEELEWIRMCEREREALWRLKEWQQLEHRAARWQAACIRARDVVAAGVMRCRQAVWAAFAKVARALVDSAMYGMRMGGTREQPWIPWGGTWHDVRREGE